MAQHRISFEWRWGEAEFERWASLAQIDSFESVMAGRNFLSSGEWHLLRHVLRSIALIAVAAIAVGASGLTSTELKRQVAREGIQSTVDREKTAWLQQDYMLFESLVDDDVANFWLREWRDYWRSGYVDHTKKELDLIYVQSLETHPPDAAPAEYAQAQVRIAQPPVEWWHTSSYQETRFYLLSNRGWVRTTPPQDYWGKRQRLETENLYFHFRERDKAAVHAAAPELELAFRKLHDTLGLDVKDYREKYHIILVSDYADRWSWPDNRVEVTSPSMARIAEGLADGEYVAERAMSALTYRVIRDATPGTASRYLYRWPVMVYGIRGWLRADLLGRLSPWQEEAVEIFQDYSRDRLPISLRTITDVHMTERPAREHVVWRFMAAETLIDYAVHTYGRETIPVLIEGLIRHSRWDEMIPNVYGVSAEAFEEGWNEYLREEYSFEPPATEPEPSRANGDG